MPPTRHSRDRISTGALLLDIDPGRVFAGRAALCAAVERTTPAAAGGRMLRRQDGSVETRPAGTETGGEIVVGYFMIRARDYAEAVEIAKQCPHLKYDGGVLVRRVGFT